MTRELFLVDADQLPRNDLLRACVDHIVTLNVSSLHVALACNVKSFTTSTILLTDARLPRVGNGQLEATSITIERFPTLDVHESADCALISAAKFSPTESGAGAFSRVWIYSADMYIVNHVCDVIGVTVPKDITHVLPSCFRKTDPQSGKPPKLFWTIQHCSGWTRKPPDTPPKAARSAFSRKGIILIQSDEDSTRAASNLAYPAGADAQQLYDVVDYQPWRVTQLSATQTSTRGAARIEEVLLGSSPLIGDNHPGDLLACETGHEVPGSLTPTRVSPGPIVPGLLRIEAGNGAEEYVLGSRLPAPLVAMAPVVQRDWIKHKINDRQILNSLRTSQMGPVFEIEMWDNDWQVRLDDPNACWICSLDEHAAHVKMMIKGSWSKRFKCDGREYVAAKLELCARNGNAAQMHYVDAHGGRPFQTQVAMPPGLHFIDSPACTEARSCVFLRHELPPNSPTMLVRLSSLTARQQLSAVENCKPLLILPLLVPDPTPARPPAQSAG